MKRDWKFWAASLAVILGLALLLSPWASQSPDGLEKVAKDKGFENKAQESPIKSPFPDYELPQKRGGFWGGALVKGAGIALVLGASVLIGALLRSKKNSGKNPSSPEKT